MNLVAIRNPRRVESSRGSLESERSPPDSVQRRGSSWLLWFGYACCYGDTRSKGIILQIWSYRPVEQWIEVEWSPSSLWEQKNKVGD
jgi:hypothetical protein